MSNYLGLAVVVVAGVLGVLALHLGHRLASEEMPPPQLPFASGAAPREHALSRFHVRWYPATVLFLAFDVEMLFMYPWAVVVAAEGAGAVAEMFLFLVVLMVGVLWAWREGALRWL